MTAALPFVAWLAAAGFRAVERSAPARVLAQTLVLSAAMVFVAAATTYPHWPDQLRNPLHELAFPLLAHGYAVHSLGTLIGLHGFLSLAPLYAVALGAAFWLLSRGPRRSVRQTALACILAAGLLAGQRALPFTGPYARTAWNFAAQQRGNHRSSSGVGQPREARRRADSSVLTSNMAMVMGPTPPGTGVMA